MKTLMPKQTIHDRSSSVRMKMMAWMREPYFWWIIHTDCMAVQSPRFDVMRFTMWFGAYTLSFGCDCQDNQHTGPPTD